jgi:hypothetical protein
MWSAQRILAAVNLSFQDFFIQVAPQLSSRGWVDPVPDPLLLRKSGSAGKRTRDLWICSRKLWPLDHRGGQIIIIIIQIKKLKVTDWDWGFESHPKKLYHNTCMSLQQPWLPYMLASICSKFHNIFRYSLLCVEGNTKVTFSIGKGKAIPVTSRGGP